MHRAKIGRGVQLPRPQWSRAVVALATLAMLASNGLTVDAQTPTGTVSGRVSADNGQPLIGAQVSLRGTGLGTRTGDNGRYMIVNVPVGVYRLRAQMLGHRPIEDSITVVAGQTVTRDFVMRVEALSLDALVVTGTAGAARQREVGNAVTQINVAAIQAPPVSVGQLLQGRATGVTVMPSSAMAGSGSMIRLRGNVSVAMSNQPLIYVDGVRLRSEGYQKNVPPTGSDLRSGNDLASPLNDINPSDIDRVEIIKGAAAATLYGTEAAAGVIQIFTKRGQAGRPAWTADVEQGFARALKFGPDPSRAPPGDTIWGCAVVNPCTGTMQVYRDSFPDRFRGLPLRGVSRAGGTSSYMFIDPWLRNAYRQRYALSVGGGGEALQYFVSGTMSDEDGVLPNDNEARKVIRGNFSFTPLRNLLFSVNTSYTKDQISNTAAGNNAHGLTLNAFRRDRNYASNDRPEVVDLMLNQEITSEIDHFITGGTVSWSPSANLTNKLTVGFDLAQIENRSLRPFGFVSAPTGIISNRTNAYQTLTFDYAGNFTFGVRPDLRSTLSWGAQSVTAEQRETSAYGENFPGADKPTVSSGGTTLGFEARERVINAGLFGQVLLDLKNRYFLTLGARVDGNSAFGADYGLQTYPKASFSWVASDESFWPSWSPAMKVRAAWGQSGRAPGAFDAVPTWDPVSWGGQPAFFQRNVGSTNLGPERTSEIEVGFDAAMFDNRVTTELTWYRRDIDAALFNVRQIPTEGFLRRDNDNTQLLNVGKMKADGVELTANATVLRRGDLEWSVGGSVYTNRTRVLELGQVCDESGCRDVAAFSLPGPTGSDFGWIMEGQPVPVIRTNICVTNPNERAAPVTSTDPNDCTHGPNLPTHTYGVQTGLQLPYGVSFTARGEYMGGHYMYDGAAFNAVNRSVRWPGCYDFYTLQETGRADQATALERARCASPADTREGFFIYPADFFKLREVSLSASVPRRYLRGATSARVTLAGYNLWKWVNKDFPVFDPETGNNWGLDARVRSILEHVPPPAVYTASMRVAF